MAFPDISTLLVAEPAILAAYVIFGMISFGTTLIAAPVLAHVLPVSNIVPLMAVLDFLASCLNGFKLGSQVQWPELRRLIPAMLLGNVVGATILFNLPTQALSVALGLFAVGYALDGLWRSRRGAAPKPALDHGWSWVFGGIGGMFSALFGAGGFIYSMYLARRLDEPAAIRATQNAVLTFSSFIRVGIFVAAGRVFQIQQMALVLSVLPAVALGLYLGHRITTSLDRRRFMQVLHGVVLLTGTSLLLRSLASW